MGNGTHLNGAAIEALKMFSIAHFAPSQIDAILNLKDGTAHYWVLWAWNHMADAMLAVHGSGGRDIWQSSTIS